MQYLGIIEQRTNELLETYQYSKGKPFVSLEIDKTKEPIDDRIKANQEKNKQNKMIKINNLLTEINIENDPGQADNKEKAEYFTKEELMEKGRKKASELLGNKIE